MSPHRRHAVVIGASMAGLLAARVLADTYDHVTVLDRDTWRDHDDPSTGYGHRGGVPQSRHSHALLARGCEVLEQLFPGLTDEAVSAGALTGDMLDRVRWYSAGRMLAQAPSGMRALALSRPLLEGLVRRRVSRHAGIELRTGSPVHDLLDDGTGRVCGVVTGGPLLADLVVDASGRTSKAPGWLERLGYPAPPEERVRIDVAYATRIFSRSPGDLDGDLVMAFAASPEQPRGGALIAQEGDRWIVTLNGYHGERPPLDLAGFISWADDLDTDLGALLRQSEPLDEGARFRFPASVRRRYERLTAFPEGLLVVGDALCSFNPSYGQGMTVAALEAAVLRRCLAEGSQRLGPRFFAATGPVVDIPWQIAVGGDLALPATQGPRSARQRLLGRYVRLVRQVGEHDPEVAIAFLRVANLEAPPQSLLAPAVLRRVLRQPGQARTPVPRFTSSPATISRWISLVPSQIRSTRSSR